MSVFTPFYDIATQPQLRLLLAIKVFRTYD